MNRTDSAEREHYVQMLARDYHLDVLSTVPKGNNFDFLIFKMFRPGGQ